MSLDDFVCAANVARYWRTLNETVDEDDRQRILDLLADEMANQARISATRRKWQQGRPVAAGGPSAPGSCMISQTAGASLVSKPPA
jgi:hypothetical protein